MVRSASRRLASLVMGGALAGALGLGACGDDGGSGTSPTDEAGGPSNEGGGSDVVTSDSTSGGDDATGDDGSGPPKLPFTYHDINGILSTGQSLSTGAEGLPVLSTSQPYDNLKFPNGPRNTDQGLTTFVPLTEDGVETMSSGLANLVTKMAREEVLVGQPAGQTSHDLLVSVHGIIGVDYTVLKKGGSGPAYAYGMAQAKAGFDVAKAMGKSYVVRAVTVVHGESDHYAGNTHYEQDLFEWQHDYETDVTAITGQTEKIPMIHTQFSSWLETKYNTTTSKVAMAQLQAHIDAPGKIILVGAKYMFPYADDGTHLNSEGYRWMGEMYAKVYRRVILEGKTWEPTRPKTVTRNGNVIRVQYFVPAPPLVIDTTAVSDPGHYGFEYADDGPSTPTITNVAIVAPDTVEITLSATPTGANKRVRYAYTGIKGMKAGATTGVRGNLRDSDATPSRNGYKLYNWAVHSDNVVP